MAKVHKADCLLSIHFNAFDKRARGVETLIRPQESGNVNHADDKAFAQRIQRAVFDVIKAHDPKTVNRGVKDQKLAVLNDVSLGNTEGGNCRACLVEIEFIDVEAVDKLLNTNPNADAVRREIAEAIAGAIIEEMGA
jgi:N-acetylmuramoyl-L-alanine amidase